MLPSPAKLTLRATFSSIHRVRNSFFHDNKQKRTITGIVPASVVSIGEGAFENCTGLKKIVLEVNRSSLYGYFNTWEPDNECNDYDKIYIKKDAFNGCPDTLKFYIYDSNCTCTEDIQDCKNVNYDEELASVFAAQVDNPASSIFNYHAFGKYDPWSSFVHKCEIPAD